jgi:hypothetical protein
MIVGTVNAQQGEILTNKSIVEMYSKNLPPSIILGKIKSSNNSFDCSTDALIILTNSKLPEEIINAMVEASSDKTKHIIQLDPNNPLDAHEPGIYYEKNNGILELIQLETSIYSQNKSSGALASAMTYGLAKVKISATIDGKNSQLQIERNQPTFYFYFDVTGNPVNQTPYWWFAVANSPNEFLLVKLTENKKTREVVIGSANIAGSSVGVDDKNKAAFKVEKLALGIYRVYFDKPMLPGEYCFMYAGTIPAGFTSINKVFDFGIAR